MMKALANDAFVERTRNIVDMSVFYLGALSLTFAIAATVLNGSSNFSTETAQAPSVETPQIAASVL